jgi:hypothetical protein
MRPSSVPRRPRHIPIRDDADGHAPALSISPPPRSPT